MDEAEALRPARLPEAGGDFETGVTKDDKLELRLWLRLLTCSNLIEHGVRRGLREEFGITLPRFDLLSQLDRAADGLTMGELSRRLMVSNGNVTGLIDRLVGEGLVERRPSPTDRRASLVRLTAAGRSAFEAMVPLHKGWIESHFAGMTREELRDLYGLLGSLKAAFEAQEVANTATNKPNAKGRRK